MWYGDDDDAAQKTQMFNNDDPKSSTLLPLGRIIQSQLKWVHEKISFKLRETQFPSSLHLDYNVVAE